MDPDTTTKPRRKAPKEVRRRQLIEAAMDVIAEKGISGATTANVTRRAGLSLGIVSLHFDGKNGLLTETLRHLAEELRDSWVSDYKNTHLSTAERLRAIAEGIFRASVCTPTKIAVWFAFFGEAQYRRIYRNMVDEFDNERSDAIEDLCVKLKQEGGYDYVNAKSLAVSIESVADGLWLSMLLYPEWMTPKLAQQSVTDMLAAHFPEHFEKAVKVCDVT